MSQDRLNLLLERVMRDQSQEGDIALGKLRAEYLKTPFRIGEASNRKLLDLLDSSQAENTRLRDENTSLRDEKQKLRVEIRRLKEGPSGRTEETADYQRGWQQGARDRRKFEPRIAEMDAEIARLNADIANLKAQTVPDDVAAMARTFADQLEAYRAKVIELTDGIRTMSNEYLERINRLEQEKSQLAVSRLKAVRALEEIIKTASAAMPRGADPGASKAASE